MVDTNKIRELLFGRKTIDELGRESFAYVVERLNRGDFTLVTTSTSYKLRFDDGRWVGPCKDLRALVEEAKKP